MPVFTVIIATYNWSAALEVALESVRDQTFTDFEVLVVGDACTDDSADVVQALNDPRFHWYNLPHNCGSQWGPNNHALAHARGTYVAYLGHDDLWWPSHLQTALETFENTDADIVAAATLLYGPRESGMRAVTGFFPHDRYTPMHFFPPSSMCHRLEIARRIGGWRSPADAMVVVDHDFLVRCHDAGARIVSTGEFTTFKFNAAWRRNAYGLRDTTEQRAHLALMRREGEAFRRRELSATLRSAAEDRLLRIELPTRRDIPATLKTAANQAFKGSHDHSRPTPRISSLGKQVYLARKQEAGFEWHGLEHSELLGAFHWSGPSTRSVLVLPVALDGPVWLSISVVQQLTRACLATAELHVNGKQFATTVRPGTHGSQLWQARVDPGLLPADRRESMHLEIVMRRTNRPIDLGLGTDRRWLGLAIGTVTIEPLRCGKSGA